MIPRLADFLESPSYPARWHLFEEAAKVARAGAWAEFGVALGTSARLLLKAMPKSSPLWLFDSWEGLPMDWVEDGRLVCGAGHFACPAPNIKDPRAHLVPGLFEATLPAWVKEHPEQLAVLHVDCDLEASASTVLQLAPIGPGTVVLFDEYHDHGRAGFGESRAWVEFVESRGVSWSYLGRCDDWHAGVIVHDMEERTELARGLQRVADIG